jgi:hypothetical protein
MSRRRNGSQDLKLGDPQLAERACARPECTAAGLYPAPRSPRQLEQRYWFCLEHVRAYNQAWDYHAGMAPEEIERCIRQDTVWHRPTWPLGGAGAWSRKFSWRDRLGLFGEWSDLPRPEASEAAPESDEGKALALFDLRPPVRLADVKARYKALAKRLHPDANGGDKAAEERLKLVNQAYTILKNSVIP